jgi:glucose-6-phosphate 1-dehydrogenase
MQIASDALVFFGATGDLAHKKIFPALQKLAKRGKLEIPVIGVAKSGWDLQQLQERAKNSVENYGGLDAEGFSSQSAREPDALDSRIRTPAERAE